jgi:hypothetical protein
LDVAGCIIKSSFGEFKLLFMALSIVVLLMSTSVYYCENYMTSTPAVEFASIPNALWWGCVTITTVGYGDVVPKTSCGQILTAAFVLLGVVTLALPMLSLVVKFMMYYEKNVSVYDVMPKTPEVMEKQRTSLISHGHKLSVLSQGGRSSLFQSEGHQSSIFQLEMHKPSILIPSSSESSGDEFASETSSRHTMSTDYSTITDDDTEETEF